jgi:hypothetical protein
MGQLIVVILVIAIIIAILNVAIPFCGLTLLFLSENLLSGADRLLGSWAFLSPWVSWFIMGSLCAGLLHFAVFEAPKLHRPAAAPVIVLLVIGLLSATLLAGPLFTRAKFNGISASIRNIVSVIGNKQKSSVISNKGQTPIPAGVYVRDTSGKDRFANIGDYFEVSSTGASGTFTTKGKTARFIFSSPSCFTNASGFQTVYLSDTMRFTVHPEALTAKTSSWIHWKGGSTNIEYSENKGLWSSIRSSQQAFNFVLDQSGILTFNGIPLSRNLRPDEWVKISPLSPSGKYRVAMKWDYDHGGSDLHIIDFKSSRVVVRWIPGFYGFQSRCLWSPDERYLLIQYSSEDLGDIYCCDLGANMFRKVPFASFAKMNKDTALELQFATLDSAVWNSPLTFKSKINIYCNNFNFRFCNKFHGPIRNYWGFVDASTLSIGYSTPIVYDSISQEMNQTELPSTTSHGFQSPMLAAILDSTILLHGQAFDSVLVLAWPFTLTFDSLNPFSGRLMGKLTWTTLNAIHSIEGGDSGDKFSFIETGFLKQGNAVLGNRYILDSMYLGFWHGHWQQAMGDIGKRFWIDCRPIFRRLLEKYAGPEWRLETFEDQARNMNVNDSQCLKTLDFCGVGDFNGDGRMDAVVGACKKDSSDFNALFVFFGPSFDHPAMLRGGQPFRIVAPGSAKGFSADSLTWKNDAIESYYWGISSWLVYWDGQGLIRYNLTD